MSTRRISQVSAAPVLFVVALLCSAGGSRVFGTPIYSVTSLGTLGGSGSIAYRISDSGYVAGWSRNSSQTYNAFLHDGSGMSNLAPAAESRAHGVNNTGQAVGTTYADGKAQATLWSEGGSTNLGTLGGADAYALAINDAGQIVGGSTNASGQGRAFLSSEGVMQDLGAYWPGGWSAAYDISNAGLVAGYGQTAGGAFRGFVWTAEGGIAMLGTLGGGNSYAFGINDSGQVAGHASLASGYVHAFLYFGGVMADLGTLGGGSSYAYGINDAGDVVGYSWWDQGPNTRAFLYRGGVMIDLNSLLPAGSGWELLEAYDINSGGQIVGAGMLNGQLLAFRLDPVGGEDSMVAQPEPGTLSMLVLGGVALGLLCRRRPRSAMSSHAK